MFIGKLKLKNFKFIKDLELEFARVNVIIGPNGSGKSTIGEAIVALLTNTFHEKMEEYIHWGEKEFEIHGQEITYKDTAFDYKFSYKGTTERLLIEAGIDTPYRQSDAVKRIKQLINPTLALYSSVSMQHQSTSILFEDNTRRLEKLKGILGMDQITSAVEEMAEISRNKRAESKSLSGEIEGLKQRTFDFIEVPKLSDIDLIKTEYDKLDQLFIEIEKQKKLYDKYLIEMGYFTKSQSELKSEEVILKKLNNKLLEIEEKIQPISDDKNWQEILVNKEKINIKKDLEEKLDSIEIKRIGKSKYSEEELTLLEDNISELTIYSKELEKKIKLAQSGKCFECGQDYTANCEDLEKELLKSKQQKEEYISELNKIKEYFQERERIEKQQVINRTKADGISEQLKQFKDIKDLEPNLTLEEIQQEKNKYEKLLEQNKQYEKDKIELSGDIKVSENKINQLKCIKEPKKIFEPCEFDYNRYKYLSDQIAVYNQKKEEISRIEEHNRKLLISKRKHLHDLKEKQKKLDSVYTEIKLLDDTRNFMGKEFSSHLIEAGTKEISQKTNEFFQRAYGGRYTIGFEQHKKGINFFYTNGVKNAPVTMASGFEQQLLGVSFRVGLYNVDPSGIFLLDEVDSDADMLTAQDSNNSMNLYRNLMAEDFEQVFCITHNSDTVDMLVNEYNAKVFETSL